MACCTTSTDHGAEVRVHWAFIVLVSEGGGADPVDEVPDAGRCVHDRGTRLITTTAIDRARLLSWNFETPIGYLRYFLTKLFIP